VIRWTGRLLKNVLGVTAAILGGVLSLPGIPGPGLLLILLGVTLVDFPGKRRLKRWLLSHQAVLNTINRLRQRYGKPPLLVERREETLPGPGQTHVVPPHFVARSPRPVVARSSDRATRPEETPRAGGHLSSSLPRFEGRGQGEGGTGAAAVMD